MFVSVLFVTFFTWIVLTLPFNWQETLVGAIVSVAVAFVVSKFYSKKLEFNVFKGLFKFLFVYIPVFVWEMVKANLDVASRVIIPKVDVKPGFVYVKPELEKDVTILTLANSITLTPGTITVDVEEKEDKKYLLIHWIEVEKDKDKIYKKFEKLLKGVFA